MVLILTRFFLELQYSRRKKKEVDANRWETFVRIINEIDTKSIHFNYKSAKEISQKLNENDQVKRKDEDKKKRIAGKIFKKISWDLLGN